MNFEMVKDTLRNWAKSKEFIKKAYIFGSRARGNYHDASDIDIAVEIHSIHPDETAKDIWMCEASGLREELKKLLNVEFDLIRYDPDDPSQTPVATESIGECRIVVYSRAEGNQE